VRFKANLALILVAVIWGSSFAAQRISAQTGSVFTFNGARFLLAALVMLPFVWKSMRFTRREAWVTILAGSVLFIASALQQAGLRTTTAANAGFLTGLYVVFVPLILFLGWREKPGKLPIVAIGLAMVGAYLLSTGGVGFAPHPGDELEILGAVFWGLHVVIVGKFGARMNLMAFSVGQYIVGGALNLGAGLLLEAPTAELVWSMGWQIAYVGLVSVGIGYTLQAWAQRHTPPTDAALILSGETVMAALAGWVFLAETLLPVQLAGCALILVAIILAQWQPSKV
jgi:drug/metabolite transporter (DMT)-like permease